MKKVHTVTYEELSLSELSTADMELVRAAREVAGSAYAPYSKFNVGASVRLEDGTVIKGSNQENIAYPSGLCAERVALFYAGSNFPEKKISVICVVANGDLLSKEKNLAPCGSCRQVMVESEMRQEKDYRVILINQNETATVFNSAKDLLPLTFGL